MVPSSIGGRHATAPLALEDAAIWAGRRRGVQTVCCSKLSAQPTALQIRQELRGEPVSTGNVPHFNIDAFRHNRADGDINAYRVTRSRQDNWRWEQFAAQHIAACRLESGGAQCDGLLTKVTHVEPYQLVDVTIVSSRTRSGRR